uniref:Peptidase M13 C-terminal domain-containing protein n=1 Tax=Stomoxys calcitrans TaxID=35570 RepID=A0A1I8Q728_STOCA
MFKIWGFLCLCGISISWGHVTFSPSFKQLQMIEESMNSSYDPCEDFYHYACGYWQSKYATADYNEMMGLLEHQINEELKKLLDKEDDLLDESESALGKLKLYYESCMMKENEFLLNYFDYVKPAADLQWPLLQVLEEYESEDWEWPAEGFDIYKLLGILQSYDFNNVLIKIGFHRLWNGTLQIHFEVPQANEAVEATVEGIANAMIFLKFPQELAHKYAEEFMESQDFWKDSYQSYEKESEPENKEYLSYEGLAMQHPELHKLLEAMLPGKLTPEDMVFISNKDYYQFLKDYLASTMASQNVTKILNYLQMKFLDFLYQDAINDCVKEVQDKMDMALSYMYFKEKSKIKEENYNAEILKIVAKIYTNLLQLLYENHSKLESSLVDKLKEKIFHLKLNIGNLPEKVSESKIDEFYDNVKDLLENNYFKNHLILLRHRFFKRLLNYQKQTHSLSHFTSTGYDEDVNMVVLPFGYLQEPLYHQDYDDIFIWSLLGYLIGHEFSHSLDQTGLKHDAQGMETTMYQDILESKQFLETMDCLEAQHEGSNVAERFADTIGIRLAFRAYVNDNRSHLQPRFTYIPWNQLFFLNTAQFYCGSNDEDAVTLHQIVKNSEDFAQAFQCPLGSSLNPEKRCRLF